MKKILVVGKNSYIGESFREHCNGKYLIDELEAKNLSPVVGQFNGYDVVVLVAGIAHIKERKENKHLYYKVNRDLAITIAKAAKEAGVNQFIFMSTMAVYGLTEGMITRETIPKPSTYYGDSKYQAELAIMKLGDSNFKVVILRPPMIYGRHCKGNYQNLRKYTLSIPFFPNYKNRRSMLYIKNLTSTIDHMIEAEAYGIYFPQDASFIKTYDMVKKIAELNGRTVYNVAFLNPLIYALKFKSSILKKIFGTLFYDTDLNVPLDWLYDVRSYKCIWETERGNQEEAWKQDTLNDNCVSIIMPVYNAERFVAESIKSVQAQTYQNWELVVVNDGSTDKSLDIIQSFAEKDRRIVICNKTKNTGIAKARNSGMKKVSGRYLAFLDSDDLWRPDKLEKQLDFMIENGGRLSFTGLSFIDEAGKSLGYHQKAKCAVSYNQLLKCNVMPTSSIMIDMKRVESFRMPDIKHEDYATWLTILKDNQIEAMGINEPLVAYRKMKNSRSGNKLETLPWTWKVYHKTQRFGLVKSTYCLGRFSINTIVKYAGRLEKRI